MVRAFGQILRTQWEDRAIAAKLEEVATLGLEECRLWAMGNLQLPGDRARIGLTMLTDLRLLHFPVAVWPHKEPPAPASFAEVAIEDIVAVRRPAWWFVLKSPRRCNRAVRLLVRDGSTWDLSVSDAGLKAALVQLVPVERPEGQ